jgi:hypothetical protein
MRALVYEGPGRVGRRDDRPATAEPPRALSGTVRRLAYRVPEHRATRWMLLLMGDKLDVLEHRLSTGLWLLPAAAALVVGYATVSRAVRR